jgi:plasmid stabilization system protein ParE
LPLNIRYSLRARQEEIEILEYVLNQFGQKKAKEVYEEIEQMLEKITSMPEMFPCSKKQKGLRKCVLSKQASIYYRISKGYIEVISFRDNRKDPDKFSA